VRKAIKNIIAILLLLIPIAVGYAHFTNAVHELSVRKRVAEFRSPEMANSSTSHGFFTEEPDPAALTCVDENKQELEVQLLKNFVVLKRDLNTELESVTCSFSDHAMHTVPLNETDDFIYFIESLLL
jgi:hypothetical protein